MISRKDKYKILKDKLTSFLESRGIQKYYGTSYPITNKKEGFTYKVAYLSPDRKESNSILLWCIDSATGFQIERDKELKYSAVANNGVSPKR